MKVYDIATKINEYLTKGYFEDKIAKVVVKIVREGELQKNINMGAQYYVEDDVLFLFTSPTYDEETINAVDLYNLLEKEGHDECWQPTSLLDRNHFLNCEIQFYNIDCDAFMDDENQKDIENLVYDVVCLYFDEKHNQFILAVE